MDGRQNCADLQRRAEVTKQMTEGRRAKRENITARGETVRIKYVCGVEERVTGVAPWVWQSEGSW